MKKQILSLILGAVVFSASPAFAMEDDHHKGSLSVHVQKKLDIDKVCQTPIINISLQDLSKDLWGYQNIWAHIATFLHPRDVSAFQQTGKLVTFAFPEMMEASICTKNQIQLTIRCTKKRVSENPFAFCWRNLVGLALGAVDPEVQSKIKELASGALDPQPQLKIFSFCRRKISELALGAVDPEAQPKINFLKSQECKYARINLTLMDASLSKLQEILPLCKNVVGLILTKDEDYDSTATYENIDPDDTFLQMITTSPTLSPLEYLSIQKCDKFTKTGALCIVNSQSTLPNLKHIHCESYEKPTIFEIIYAQRPDLKLTQLTPICWVTKAAEQGNSNALANLATMYANAAVNTAPDIEDESTSESENEF